MRTLFQEDINGEKLTVKKWWIFCADFPRFTQSFSLFMRDINGEKEKTSRYWWSFSRLVFHGLPPLDFFPLQHSKTPRTPNFSKICPDDCFSGNRRNTVSRVLFRRRELTEPHWVLGQTRWVLRKTRCMSSLWRTNNRLKGTQWVRSPELGEGQKTHWARCLKPCSPKPYSARFRFFGGDPNLSKICQKFEKRQFPDKFSNFRQIIHKSGSPWLEPRKTIVGTNFGEIWGSGRFWMLQGEKGFAILGTIIFVIIFVIITKIIPPEHFLCNVAATRLSLFAREHAKEFALWGDCFVIFTKLIVPKQLFLKSIFVIVLATMVRLDLRTLYCRTP